MFYIAIRLLARVFYRLVFRFTVIGRENVPKDGPVLYCANHFNGWDPVSIGISIQRRVYFMAKVELFRLPPVAWFLSQLGAFPVKRGTADRQALRRAIALLESGQVVGIFPEGTRSRTGYLLQPEPGMAWLQVKSGATVLPAAVAGHYSLWSPVVVVIGKPMSFPPFAGGRASATELEHISQEIMAEIAKLHRQARQFLDQAV